MTRVETKGRVVNESETFTRFLEGDDAAFMELFDRYDRRLRMYCLKIVSNQEVAEDLVQELWERVIKMRNNPTEVLEPARYLLRMARNLCLKYIGRERRHTSLDDLYESDHPTESAHEPSHLEELVKLALEQLPFEQREVLTLHNYCGYGYEDIAAIRGETLGSVKMRAMRARARIGRIVAAFLALGNEGEERPNPDAEMFIGGSNQ
ncbi:MAG: RNA polymerase sigma factor [Bacteroidetes bacterium]|nr:RNA polymerase sigma factor [Bacteroidota bacterium]